MTKAPAHYAARANARLLRSLGVPSAHAAIQARTLTHEEWAARVEGCERQFWATNGQRARRTVQSRHPVKLENPT